MPASEVADTGARRVIVFGGSGRTGRLVVQEAARDGHTVTIAARNPEALHGPPTDLPVGVAVVRADVRDARSAAAALDGQDALVLAVSSSARRPDGLYSAAARSIVAAAHDRLRAVVISSGGVNRHDRGLPLWYRRLLIPADHGRAVPGHGAHGVRRDGQHSGVGDRAGVLPA